MKEENKEYRKYKIICFRNPNRLMYVLSVYPYVRYTLKVKSALLFHWDIAERFINQFNEVGRPTHGIILDEAYIPDGKGKRTNIK